MSVKTVYRCDRCGDESESGDKYINLTLRKGICKGVDVVSVQLCGVPCLRAYDSATEYDIEVRARDERFKRMMMWV